MVELLPFTNIYKVMQVILKALKAYLLTYCIDCNNIVIITLKYIPCQRLMIYIIYQIYVNIMSLNGNYIIIFLWFCLCRYISSQVFTSAPGDTVHDKT